VIPHDEVRSTVEGALCRHFGRARRIVEFRRAPSQYRSSFALEDLTVRLDDGRSLEILFKDVSPSGLSDAARAAKPAFLSDPRREIRTYSEALNPSRLGTAVCYGAIEDGDSGRFWLFIEKVAGRELYQVGEIGIWRQVAVWLAGLHGYFAPQVESFRGTIPLLKYDGDFYRLWPKRALAFLSRAVSAEARRRLERIAAGYDRVVERLTALPVTLIHGEFYASNVLVQETPAGLSEKAELAMAYGAPPSLDYCRLHLAMQWLGWAENWSPPPEHSHDWLNEALTLAEQLGL
jgi:Phosphotransferase enzyme family